MCGERRARHGHVSSPTGTIHQSAALQEARPNSWKTALSILVAAFPLWSSAQSEKPITDVIDMCINNRHRGARSHTPWAMRPRGTPEELERRRRRAIDLLKAGASITEVARRLGCSHSSVILWRDAVRWRGPGALRAKPATGRPPKLSERHRGKLLELLLRGAGAWGFETDLWTTRRIATVIQREFRVRLHRAHVGRVLTELGGGRARSRNGERSSAMRPPSPAGSGIAGPR